MKPSSDPPSLVILPVHFFKTGEGRRWGPDLGSESFLAFVAVAFMLLCVQQEQNNLKIVSQALSRAIQHNYGLKFTFKIEMISIGQQHIPSRPIICNTSFH